MDAEAAVLIRGSVWALFGVEAWNPKYTLLLVSWLCWAQLQKTLWQRLLIQFSSIQRHNVDGRRVYLMSFVNVSSLSGLKKKSFYYSEFCTFLWENFFSILSYFIFLIGIHQLLPVKHINILSFLVPHSLPASNLQGTGCIFICGPVNNNMNGRMPLGDL